MALGTMLSVSASAAVGPIFFDNVSQAGEASYLAGGSTGLLAKLRALRGDQRAIVAVAGYSAEGYVLRYDPATDKLAVLAQDAGGALAEVADTTNLSAVIFLLDIISK